MDADKMNKREYVKQQEQTRKHECHWPSCKAQIPPAMWGCKKHWFKLPKRLRDLVWAFYVPGQEVTGTPSQGYMEVMNDVYEWIYENFPEEAPEGYHNEQ